MDINQFWSLLTQSQLVGSTQLQSLFNEFSTAKKTAQDSNGLAEWLVGKGVLSPYQAKLILAGHSGPFQYGAYGVVDRLFDGALAGCFTAFHRKSGHRVLLEFLPGNEPQDLQVWKTVAQTCEQLEQLQPPFCTSVYDADVVPDYRFVVSEIPAGKSIAQMPPKSRLPCKQACAVMARIGNALASLHERNICHGALDHSMVWISSGGDARLRLAPVGGAIPLRNISEEVQIGRLKYLAPEVDPYLVPESVTPEAEVYSFGCLLIRLLTARDYCPETKPDSIRAFHQNPPQLDLSKYEIDDEMVSLISKALAVNPIERPSMREVADLITLYSGHAEQIAQGTPAPDQKTLAKRNAFLASLQPSMSKASNIGAPIPIAIDTGAEGESSDLAPEARVQLAREKAEQRKKGKWKVPVAIAGCLMLLMSTIVGALYYLNSQITDLPNQETVSQSDPRQLSIQEESNDVLSESGEADRDVKFLQTLIDNDALTLWESPTTGIADPCKYLPVAPKMILQIRFAALMAIEESQNLIKSFGPEMESQFNKFQGVLGVPFEQMERLTVTFHDDDEAGYDLYALVTTQPLSEERLMELWGNPNRQETESGQAYFETDSGMAYWIIESGDVNEDSMGENTDNESRTRFAYGPTQLVQSVASSGGGIPLAGPMQELASWSDSKRHFNFLFLRPALFNDRGQAWMGESLDDFNRELSVMIPDGVQGGLVGFHVDQGNYLEIRFNRIADLSAGVLRQSMIDGVNQQVDQLTELVAGIYPNPYWDRIRVKFMAMVLEVTTNFRWSVERGEVVGNVWLPPAAAHNLIAATELISSFSEGAALPVTENESSIPKNVQELLARKRDLEVANPPDLNVLMAELKKEIDSDFGDLPFEWDIKIQGGDLEKEGITKNQRPSELNMKQISLAEILTKIMVSANPDKDISGASDPNCKLIWVVAENPTGAGQQAILITTRAAAEANGYDLPAAFR